MKRGSARINQRLLTAMAGMLLVLTVPANFSWAVDTVKISALLADPTGWNSKLVRVDGTVVNLQTNHFIGNNTRLEKCIQRFAVRDDTGTIQAIFTTICPNEILVKNGDRVSMEARFSGVLEVRSVIKH